MCIVLTNVGILYCFRTESCHLMSCHVTDRRNHRECSVSISRDKRGPGTLRVPVPLNRNRDRAGGKTERFPARANRTLNFEKCNRSEPCERIQSNHEGGKGVLEKCYREAPCSNWKLLLEKANSCLELWEHTTVSTKLFQIQSSASPTSSHVEPETKIPGEPRSREQSTAISELSFALGSRVSLQLMCKVPVS